jgi:hypothetical protein
MIVPIAREAQAKRITACWACQSAAVDLLFAPAPGVRLTGWTCGPTSTIGEARNVALSAAAYCGYDVALFCDDDNYYGPDYAAEFLEAFAEDKSLVVAFKPLAFVRHDDGLWWYDEKQTRFFPGHSTAVRVREAALFPAASFAEDVEWSRRMAGAKSRRLSPWGLVYDRRDPKSHAYDAEREVFLRQHGPARFLGHRPDTAVDTPFETTAPWTHVSDADIFAAMRRRASCY